MSTTERCITTGALRGFLPASLCAASGLATLLAPAPEVSDVLLLGLSAITLACGWTAWKLVQSRHRQTERNYFTEGLHPLFSSGLPMVPKPINMARWQAEQDKHQHKDRSHSCIH